MFTGIIESLGKVKAIEKDRSNVHFNIESPISRELKIDQSVSHNGVCLTVVEVGEYWHRVTAVAETLSRTNLGHWQPGTLVNLERCLPIGGRLDGHMQTSHHFQALQWFSGTVLSTYRHETRHFILRQADLFSSPLS